jgi:ribosomal protein S20
MGFELKGFNELSKTLEQVRKALQSLGGEVAKVQFDPNNRQEVERAIRNFERKVDSKVAAYSSTPAVREMATEIKREFRKDILKKAEDARRKSQA